MNDMTLFLDLILMASGAYCMYTFLRLAVTKRLFKNGLLVPKEKKISDCADEQMYIGYMMPPLAVMAVMTMGYGVCMLAVLGSLVWYAIRNSRANRDYFGM